MKNQNTIIIIIAIAVAIILGSVIPPAVYNAQNRSVQTAEQNSMTNECESNKDVTINLGASWNSRWSTATTDPGGQLRAEGRQISSTIATLLNQCVNVFDDHSKLTLTQMATVISGQIDRNINYGPSNNPPGPPIT
jgi:predicted PurR-regulated permease PerM